MWQDQTDAKGVQMKFLDYWKETLERKTYGIYNLSINTRFLQEHD